jgi:putative acetyltransferase
MEELLIRKTMEEDLEEILNVLRSAFESEEEAELVQLLLSDPTAEPRVSLLAFLGEQAVGHILFTNLVFDPSIGLAGSLLAPLAVDPAFQKKGIGGKLIQKGIRILAERGVDWVFVLGHESYYPRQGFRPAIEQGFEPPYPIPAEFSNAWMAQALTPTCISNYQGMVIPAKSFDDPKYWGE